MAGFVGTAIGLSLQAKSLAGGATSFTALATSLFTTASGGIAAALIAIMTFNLEAGATRAARQSAWHGTLPSMRSTFALNTLYRMNHDGW
jgi:hypothetical protein